MMADLNISAAVPEIWLACVAISSVAAVFSSTTALMDCTTALTERAAALIC